MITKVEFDRRVIESLTQGHADEQTDNEGQIVIYTGMYEWSDGSIHDEPDPDQYGTDHAASGAV